MCFFYWPNLLFFYLTRRGDWPQAQPAAGRNGALLRPYFPQRGKKHVDDDDEVGAGYFESNICFDKNKGLGMVEWPRVTWLG